LSGSNPLGFVVLLLAFACAVFTIVAAVMVVRSRVPRRWLWAAFALIGVPSFTMNWTTGQVSVAFLSIALFSAGFVTSGLGGPWLVTVAFPVGAIAAMRKARSARSEGLLPKPEPVTVESPPSEAT
jgi:hypothetical protein